MVHKSALKFFDDKKVRTLWDDDQEKWYFSIVDVIEVLTDSPRSRKYWNALKTKLLSEGSQLSHSLGQLEMPSADGKMYLTDVADSEQLFRLIQSIPSPKAEPFKVWLAKIARERLDELQDPELTFDESKKVAFKGGNVAKVAREELEANTGKKVVSPLNGKAIREQTLKNLE